MKEPVKERFKNAESTETEPEAEGAADASEQGGGADVHVPSGRHEDGGDECEHQHVVAIPGNLLLLLKIKLGVHVGEGAGVQAFSFIAYSSWGKKVLFSF